METTAQSFQLTTHYPRLLYLIITTYTISRLIAAHLRRILIFARKLRNRWHVWCSAVSGVDMHRTDDESDEGEKSGTWKRERKKDEEGGKMKEERERSGWKKQREYIKFNLNQPSFIDVARISDTCHQKLDTCTWLYLSSFISVSHYRSRASALSPSHRCCMTLSLCPRCLFTT